MSAALGAALKKIAVALLSDPKTLKKVGGIVLTLLVAVIMPIAAVIAIFSSDFEIDVPEFQRLAIQNLTPEQWADLQFIEDTGNEIQAALTARGQEKRLKEALVLFLFALGDFAHEPGFAAKLAGCFTDNQTHAELIAAVNAAFGTDIDPDDFEKIMSFVNRQIVDVARSQLGNVGGEPYWSWYGFPSRVEWCACFVSCVRKRWASPTLTSAGILIAVLSPGSPAVSKESTGFRPEICGWMALPRRLPA